MHIEFHIIQKKANYKTIFINDHPIKDPRDDAASLQAFLAFFDSRNNYIGLLLLNYYVVPYFHEKKSHINLSFFPSQKECEIKNSFISFLFQMHGMQSHFRNLIWHKRMLRNFTQTTLLFLLLLLFSIHELNCKRALERKYRKLLYSQQHYHYQSLSWHECKREIRISDAAKDLPHKDHLYQEIAKYSLF